MKFIMVARGTPIGCIIVATTAEMMTSAQEPGHYGHDYYYYYYRYSAGWPLELASWPFKTFHAHAVYANEAAFVSTQVYSGPHLVSPATLFRQPSRKVAQVLA